MLPCRPRVFLKKRPPNFSKNVADAFAGVIYDLETMEVEEDKILEHLKIVIHRILLQR